MKHTSRIILFLTAVLLNAAFVFGQEKEITAEQFSAITDKADALLEKTAYRTFTAWERFADSELKNLSKTFKTSFESVPPNRTRFVYEDEDGKNERITIGEKNYTRKGEGKWELEKPNGRFVLGLRNEMENIKTVHKFLEKNTLNGKSANIYQRTRTYFDNSQQIEREVTETFWIGINGQYLKRVTEVRNLKAGYADRNTAIYEYDPKIKITAPIK